MNTSLGDIIDISKNPNKHLKMMFWTGQKDSWPIYLGPT